jgi:hypothetical protein
LGGHLFSSALRGTISYRSLGIIGEIIYLKEIFEICLIFFDRVARCHIDILEPFFTIIERDRLGDGFYGLSIIVSDSHVLDDISVWLELEVEDVIENIDTYLIETISLVVIRDGKSARIDAIKLRKIGYERFARKLSDTRIREASG